LQALGQSVGKLSEPEDEPLQRHERERDGESSLAETNPHPRRLTDFERGGGALARDAHPLRPGRPCLAQIDPRSIGAMFELTPARQQIVEAAHEGRF
jgi:hypothetical protein